MIIISSQLIKRDEQYLRGIDLAIWVNNYHTKRYTSLTDALINIGMTAVSLAVRNEGAKTIASALGVGVLTSNIYDLLSESSNRNALEGAMDQMKSNNERGAISIVTEHYRWTSGSGNHETTYQKITQIRYLING